MLYLGHFRPLSLFFTHSLQSTSMQHHSQFCVSRLFAAYSGIEPDTLDERSKVGRLFWSSSLFIGLLDYNFKSTFFVIYHMVSSDFTSTLSSVFCASAINPCGPMPILSHYLPFLFVSVGDVYLPAMTYPIILRLWGQP